MTFRLRLATALSLIACFNSAAADAPPSADESSRRDRITVLGLQSIPGSMPTFYSPHAEARAKYLQHLLGGQMAFYADVFHVSLTPITLAVLNRQQWPIVAGQEPYGMPSVDGTNPPVFVMPVSWDEVKWMAIPARDQVPSDLLRRALANDKRWEQVRFEGCDGIGTHEIGHSIIRQLGIYPPTKWFNEFLASYVGYAYLKAKAPAEALSSEIFWTAGLQRSPHPCTKLQEFDDRYDELQQAYPANYGWYQLAFDQRVIEIYALSGVEFLRTVRKKFADHALKLNSRQLIGELENINPGWTVWAERLEAGNLKAVLAP